MAAAGRFSVPPDHPSLPGHFPGQPVVPGVVLLDEVLACLPGTLLLNAKFVAPVRPNEVVEVSSQPAAAGRITFACTAGGRPVLQGTLLLIAERPA